MTRNPRYICQSAVTHSFSGIYTGIMTPVGLFVLLLIIAITIRETHNRGSILPRLSLKQKDVRYPSQVTNMFDGSATVHEVHHYYLFKRPLIKVYFCSIIFWNSTPFFRNAYKPFDRPHSFDRFVVPRRVYYILSCCFFLGAQNAL